MKFVKRCNHILELKKSYLILATVLSLTAL